MSVFDGSLTTPLSASYAILLDSFDSSIQELAQLLSLALPTGTEAEARTAFVAKLVSEARRATGAQEEEAEGDQEAPVPVAEDPKAKVTVLQHVAAAIDAQDVSLMSQKGKASA